mgnify:CR=1 FL=1
MAEVYLGVGIDASGAKQGANEFNNATDKIIGGANKADKATEKFNQQLKSAQLYLKLAATAAAYFAVRTISDYTYALAEAQAVTKATASEMQQLQAVTRQLGATTVFSAAQAAEGVKFLGMAGFETSKIISALPATLDLAAAASLSMGQAADITSNIMSGFGLAADEAGRSADVLAAIASSANTDVSGMGQAMKYVGPIARSLGISMEDTAAAVGVLANQGIQGSMAGTGLKTSLSALLNPSKAAQKAIKDLGLSLDEINPQTNKLDVVIRRLADAGLDAESAFTIFGQRGATAMLALTGAVPDLEKLLNVTNNSAGAAKRMADIMRDTLKNDVELLKSAIAELALVIGDAGLTGAVRGYIQQATRWVDSLNQTLSGIIKNREQAQMLTDALNILKNAVIALMALKLAEWLFLAGKAMRLLTLAMSANPYVIAGTAIAALILHIKDLKSETSDLEKITHNQTTALKDMANQSSKTAASMVIDMLKTRRAALLAAGSISDIDKQLTERSRQRSQREQLAGSLAQKTGEFTDPGTAAMTGGFYDPITAELNARKIEILSIDKEIASLEQKSKMYGTKAFKDGRQIAKSFVDGILSIKKQDVVDFLSGYIPGLSSEAPSAAPAISPMGMTSETAEKAVLQQERIATLYSYQYETMKKQTFEAIKSFQDQEAAIQKHIKGLEKQAETEQKRLELTQQYGTNIAEIDTQMQLYNATREYGLKVGSAEYAQIEEQIRAQKEAAEGVKKLEEARKKELEQTQKAEEAHKQWAQSMTYAFKDAIMNSKNLGDALSNLANRVQNMIVNKALDSLLGGLFGGMFAKGAAFQAGGVTAFASGGVVSSPSLFPMANKKTGLMGEAGPEAIMPLTRTSSGDLGVKAVGSGGSMVIAPQINITVEGGSQEQNQDAANKVSAAVRKAIDDTIMTVLLRERRPGGALR